MDKKSNIQFSPMRFALMFILAFFSTQALCAESAAQENSVEQNIQAMDTNKDGMVSTEEMKFYLQSLHGSSYQQEALDSMEASMSSKSCGSPFSHAFY